MNPNLAATKPYPFELLRNLLENTAPPAVDSISMTVGEPQHAPAACAVQAIREHAVEGVANYPLTRGGQALRESISHWLSRRFDVTVDSDSQVLPVNGTREALFAIAQALVDQSVQQPTVIVPNPFYQIYEGAALLAGAEPWYWSTRSEHGLPELAALRPDLLQRCQLVYICSPANPNGAVADKDWYCELLRLAEHYDFTIVADECYAEIYRDTPPISLLEAAIAVGNHDFKRCLVFHSLSKRSNLPGLRSGFVAGDAELIRTFARYRTYHGSAMSPLVQAASASAWADDAHVAENRAHYHEKFSLFTQMLKPHWNIRWPAGGFYIWGRCNTQAEAVVRALYKAQNLTLLPGAFLARDDETGNNPGEQFVRLALTPDLETTREAANRIVAFCQATDGRYLSP